MLQVRDLTPHYGTSQALFGMSFDLKAGQVATLRARQRVVEHDDLPAGLVGGCAKPGTEAWRWPDPVDDEDELPAAAGARAR